MLDTTNTGRIAAFLPGALVSTPDGFGTVRYVTADGWYGVRIDGESVTHEWQRCQLGASS